MPLAGGEAEAAAVPEPEPEPEIAVASLDGAAGSANLENGRQLYSATCVVCHGDRAQGNPALNSPRLAGQESWYVERQLKNFISGARGTDPSDVFGMQMRPMAMTLRSDQDIADVAAWLSSLN